MTTELTSHLQTLQDEYNRIRPALKLDEKQSQLSGLQEQMNTPGFWDDPDTAQKISQRASHLEGFLSTWQEFEKDLQELTELLSSASDAEATELTTDIERLEKTFQEEQTAVFLSGEYDEHNAILTLKVGNGGQDAEDFTQMLERQYLRYAEKKDWKVQVLEESITDDGLRSAILEIQGTFAYGLLKSEHGVHRLIRLSPFNAKSLRQTSFARVEVLPEIEQDTDIELDEKDLRVDVFRASGHGGQSVNTTDSAVRITYLPLNLSVSCQNEKSQLQNKQSAMKVLKSRLLQLKLEQHAQEIDELRGDRMENSFGSQIRTYTLQPYKLVKDHRTDYEETNPDSVFDGEIDGFIRAYLQSRS